MHVIMHKNNHAFGIELKENLEAIDREETTKDTLLETSAKNNHIILFIHCFKRSLSLLLIVYNSYLISNSSCFIGKKKLCGKKKK